MISCYKTIQNEHHLMTEKAKVKSLTFPFSLSRKYLADIFSFCGKISKFSLQGKVWIHMYVPLLWSHLSLIIYVGEKCIK